MIFRESILSWGHELRASYNAAKVGDEKSLYVEQGRVKVLVDILIIWILCDRTFFRASLAYYPILKAWSVGACMVWTKRFRDCIYCTILMYDMSSWMAFGGEQQATIQAKLTARGFEE